MTYDNPYAPSFDELPGTIPVFPLEGVLLLPRGDLPLNIFEPRYLKMFDDALKSHRMIGIVQPDRSRKESVSPALCATGCVGKIVDFSETSDGRYVLSLHGICRFHVDQELSVTTPYRQIRPNWDNFKFDVIASDPPDIDRERMSELLGQYFEMQGFQCDWQKIKDAPITGLLTSLCMICPFDSKEKQALLEAKTYSDRADLFMRMIEIAIHEPNSSSKH